MATNATNRTLVRPRIYHTYEGHALFQLRFPQVVVGNGRHA